MAINKSDIIITVGGYSILNRLLYYMLDNGNLHKYPPIFISDS